MYFELDFVFAFGSALDLLMLEFVSFVMTFEFDCAFEMWEFEMISLNQYEFSLIGIKIF